MMDWRSWGVLLTGTACFLSFSWAVRFHFDKAGRLPRGMQVVSAVSFLAFTWFLYGLGSRPGGFRLAPFALCVLSLLLFWWCIRHTRRKRFPLAFSPDAPALLDTQGPYQVVRHPFYLAYLLFWVATALAVPGLLPWAVPAVMAALYTAAAAKEEAEFADSILASEYQRYRMRTGMFTPMLLQQLRQGQQA